MCKVHVHDYNWCKMMLQLKSDWLLWDVALGLTGLHIKPFSNLGIAWYIIEMMRSNCAGWIGIGKTWSVAAVYAFSWTFHGESIFNRSNWLVPGSFQSLLAGLGMVQPLCSITMLGTAIINHMNSYRQSVNLSESSSEHKIGAEI